MATGLNPKVSDYARIAEAIRSRIASGVYAPGRVLPSEERLAAEFGVSRVTVNRAIRVLRIAGEVTVARGVGTRVRPLPVLHRPGGELDPDPAGESVTFDPLPARVVTVTGQTAAALGRPDGDSAVLRDRLMLVDGYPARIVCSWWPWPVVEAHRWLLNTEAGQGREWSRLAEEGTVAGRWCEQVRVGPVGREERLRLRLDHHQPVTRIRRVRFDAGGVVLGVCDHVLPAHQWVLDYDIKLDATTVVV